MDMIDQIRALLDQITYATRDNWTPGDETKVALLWQEVSSLAQCEIQDLLRNDIANAENAAKERLAEFLSAATKEAIQ